MDEHIFQSKMYEKISLKIALSNEIGLLDFVINAIKKGAFYKIPSDLFPRTLSHKFALTTNRDDLNYLKKQAFYDTINT